MSRTCHVCGSERYQTLFKPSKSPGPVVKCSECGFVYVNPIDNEKSLIQEGPVLGTYPPETLQSDNLDHINGTWEEPLIESFLTEVPAKEKNAQDALNHLDKFTTNRGRLLDFGSGLGLFLSVAKANGWDCYGLEPLVMFSVYARGKFGVKITTDTLHKDTFPPEYFNVITSFQVYEHIVEPIPVTQMLRSFLKPGGYILIEVPNIDTLGVRLLKSKHRHFVEDHVSFFSAETLGRFLDKMGFEVCDVYYPVRTMSMRHLSRWVTRVTGESVGGNVEKVIDKAGVSDKMVRLSFGDIVAVIARKVD